MDFKLQTVVSSLLSESLYRGMEELIFITFLISCLSCEELYVQNSFLAGVFSGVHICFCALPFVHTECPMFSM